MATNKYIAHYIWSKQRKKSIKTDAKGNKCLTYGIWLGRIKREQI